MKIPANPSQATPQPVAVCNWPADFPYAPKAEVRLYHTGDTLHVIYDVTEDVAAAVVTEDNGEVWTDSCMEFFISLDGVNYYNFEATCIGKLLLGYRQPGKDPIMASPEVLASIKRSPSLGTEPFAERQGPVTWQLHLEIPATALFQHNLSSWSGLDATINVYKCGDNLSKPHFLSLFPIDHPTPCFHLPQFFGKVSFE